MSQSQSYVDYAFEPTQLSQPYFSQTQNTQGTAFANSQVEPRRKYWAVFIPTNPTHNILKVPWARPSVQLGRGPHIVSKNDVVLPEKRISNVHCRITLGMQGPNGSGSSGATVQSWKDGEAEPEVWIEDLKSSNGTFVNGSRVNNTRRLLQHGDEISLGHSGTLENHDVRYIFRSVGSKGMKVGQNGSKGHDMVGAVYERYQLLDRLGKGTFAEVRKAVDVETGALRAIKQIIKHRFAGNAKTMLLFQREIEISKNLEHENICRLLDSYEDPQHICLVLEYINGGDMLDYIMNWPNELGGGLPEDHAAELTVQICRAMAYTHSMGVTHRDLKPENILLAQEDGSSPIVKIADFGLAKMVHAETMLTSMVGTPQYLAPEVVMQTKHQPGYENVVDSCMMTKALPFDEDANLPVEQRIKARYTQPADTELLYRLNISDLAIDFISGLLAKEPSQRLSMSQALEHEWLAGPSSQHSESQIQALGGDSTWSIESFEDDYPPSGGRDEDGGWSRPMTASGTNYESVGEFGGSGSGSEESFSQPMGNLHLNTPLMKSIIRQGEPGMLPISELTPANSLPPSPPSSANPPQLSAPSIAPKFAATPVLSVEPLKGPANGSNLRVEMVDNEADQVALPTPNTPGPDGPGSKAKRKFGKNGPGNENEGENGNGDAMFSSGSLSPPPGVQDVAIKVSGSGKENIATNDEKMSMDEDRIEVPLGVDVKNTNGLTKMPTRQSTRSTRARKSMRLA